MVKKYLLPSIFCVFAVFELILGTVLTYEIGIRYAEPFGIYNLFYCIMLFCPVLYMSLSLIGKGIHLYKISIGEFGVAHNCKNNLQNISSYSDCLKKLDLAYVSKTFNTSETPIKKQNISINEIILYILSIIIFVLGMFVSLFLGFTLPASDGFEFNTFAIALVITIFASFTLLSKAMNNTYMRMYNKLHHLQILLNFLNKKEDTSAY